VRRLPFWAKGVTSPHRDRALWSTWPAAIPLPAGFSRPRHLFVLCILD